MNSNQVFSHFEEGTAHPQMSRSHLLDGRGHPPREIAVLMEILDNNAISIDITVGNAVRIRRAWQSPYAGRLGVVSAIEPNDHYGMYLIEFEDGLEFRYKRHELEPTQARSSYYQERAVRTLLRLGRLLIRRLASQF